MDRLLAVRDQILGYMKEALLEELGLFKTADCEIERTIVAHYNINFVIRVASDRYLRSFRS
jgi:hypothetical protein